MGFWSNIRVEDVATNIVQESPNLTVGPSGDIYAVWVDYRNSGRDIYFARSIDEGLSFESNIQVDDMGTSPCHQISPKVAAAPNGDIYVIWINVSDI